MPATINPSLWRGAAGLAASLGLCNLAPDVRAGSAKTKGRDQAPQIDRPHRLDVGGGISKSNRANLHPGYAAVQRLIDHNAARRNKEIAGQKYSYFDMQRAAADHGLTIGKSTLAKMVQGDPSVGLRPGQARLLPPQAEKDLALPLRAPNSLGSPTRTGGSPSRSATRRDRRIRPENHPRR